MAGHRMQTWHNSISPAWQPMAETLMRRDAVAPGTLCSRQLRCVGFDEAMARSGSARVKVLVAFFKRPAAAYSGAR